ncbi:MULTISPECIES: hypothetical protein [unclassified Spirosoma]|mgnify:CR=1 FL=1|uniref:hypothetical protein n=1 Tax=unclassified Spirosoma TaxID=2621999 RepID=UPI000963EE4C|nr:MULTISPECIES: hypothetical protein [unclassified Spirosoma]MBN8822527.1 hypothetical protein [Spirosoma sp.]OJW74028.1 MAG: hypothetical protein BGO59_12905 [Spirosoma sp. 48-14]
MTLFQRFQSFFSRTTPVPATLTPASLVHTPSVSPGPKETINALAAYSIPAVPVPAEPLPHWLADEESLRDEGVLFGLSDARPDSKLAQIRAYFAQLTAPFEEAIGQYTEKISELNLFIEQRENRLTALRDQLDTLRDKQPGTNNLFRNSISLVLSLALCVGNYFLIDETLQPAFANRWIAVGVFLAGMFNLAGRTSFFYETNTRLTVRRLLEEVGLPLATSVFIFIQALQSQPVIKSIGLFIFVFFLFLLAGKLLLNTLSAIQTDLLTIQQNRQLLVQKAQNIAIWEADIERLTQEIDAFRMQKWPIVTALNQAETNLTRLNTQRDGFVHLFISEFELARSLRDRLTEQQRKGIINYE